MLCGLHTCNRVSVSGTATSSEPETIMKKNTDNQQKAKKRKKTKKHNNSNKYSWWKREKEKEKIQKHAPNSQPNKVIKRRSVQSSNGFGICSFIWLEGWVGWETQVPTLAVFAWSKSSLMWWEGRGVKLYTVGWGDLLLSFLISLRSYLI